MPDHRHFMPPAKPWEAPPPQRGRCQHKQPQWFTKYFDPNTSESTTYFVGRRDVGDDIWVNRLQRACASAQTCFELPYDNTHTVCCLPRSWIDPICFSSGTTQHLADFICSLAVPIAVRSQATTSPSIKWIRWGLNPKPDFFNGKTLKELPCVRAAFRAYLAKVLDAPELATAERCRHLHQDTPPLALQNLQ